MKKIIFFFLFIVAHIYNITAQEKTLIPSKIYQCEIIDTNIFKQVVMYIKRNFKSNDDGIVVVKLPNYIYDKTNFEFYISEILKKETLESAKSPVAFANVNNRFILFYGYYDIKNCELEKYDFYKKRFMEKLVADVNRVHKDVNYATIIAFDPEIIKITVENNKVVAIKHIATQLDLR